MTFELTIDVDNAAFEDEGLGTEVARILRSVANRVEGETDPEGVSGKLRDVNGNTVGEFKFES